MSNQISKAESSISSYKEVDLQTSETVNPEKLQETPQKTTSLGGRFFRKIGQGSGVIFEYIGNVCKMIFSAPFLMIQGCGCQRQRKRKWKEDGTTNLLKKAEENYQQAQKALEYILAQKVEGTIGLANHFTNELILLLKSSKNSNSNAIPLNEINSLEVAIEEYRKDLNSYLKKLEDPQTETSLRDLASQIFKRSSAFTKILQQFTKKLPNGSPVRKNCVHCGRCFVKSLNSQQLIYKHDSSDSYLNTLRDARNSSKEAVQILKQKIGEDEKEISRMDFFKI